MTAALVAAILVYLTPVNALEVSARSAVVLDGDSGAVLWEKNAGEKSLIASTTKIMTALVTLERTDPDEVVTVPQEAAGIEGSSVYLRAGETLTVRDLLYGMMLQSGNDAATALAVYVSGSEDAFAAEMNRKAQELGLKEIHFANPHGLDSEENYATAYSLGKLAAAAMKNPEFRKIVSSKSYSGAGRTFQNHNKLLWSYPGAMGVKTGYTRKAGRILVGCAERNGRRLISVTISDPQDWNDHSRMLDYGFSQYESRNLVNPGDICGQLSVLSGPEDYVNLVAAEPVSFSMLPEEQAEYRLLTAPFVYAPVNQGCRLGTMQVFVAGKLVANVPIEAKETVALQPESPGFLASIRDSIFR